MSRIESIITILIQETYNLWSGKGADVEKISQNINDGVQYISNDLPRMQAAGIDFPVEYVSNAMQTYTIAMKQRDDYLLADNLMYEWKEIFTVYHEVMNEI